MQVFLVARKNALLSGYRADYRLDRFPAGHGNPRSPCWGRGPWDHRGPVFCLLKARSGWSICHWPLRSCL